MAVYLVMQVLAWAQPDAAVAAFETGRLSEARTLLEARKDGASLALLARVYWGLKLPGPAKIAARNAEAAGPNLPAVQHHLALYFAQSGQRQLAAQWEGRFADSPGADPAAPLRAAMLYAEVRQWPEAARYGRLALSRQDRPETRRLLAQAAEANQQPEEALLQQRALLRKLPYDESAHAELGQLLLRLGRFAEAVTFLEDAATKFDRSPSIELALGVAYYSQRRFAEAGTHLLRVIDLDAAIPQPYIFLARMIDQLPDRVPAILARAEAWYKNDSRNGFAPYVYALARQASGAPDDQLKPLLIEAIHRDPRIWEFPFELGQLFERQRDFAAAAGSYESSLALNAKVPEIHYRLARAYDRLGQSAKAEEERRLHRQLLGSPKAGMK